MNSVLTAEFFSQRQITLNELWAVVTAKVFGRATYGEQVLQNTDHVLSGERLATSIAKHSRVYASVTTSNRSWRPSSVRSVTMS